MDPIPKLRAAIEQAAPIVATASMSDYGKPTPCAEWDVEKLINHMIGALAMFRDVGVNGEADPALFTRDLIAGDAAAAFAASGAAAALQVLRGNRDLVVNGLNSLGYGELMHKPDATYLGWVDLSQFDLEDEVAFLRTHGDVAVTAGEEHGASGAGFVRLNLATPEDVLTHFLERTERALHLV